MITLSKIKNSLKRDELRTISGGSGSWWCVCAGGANIGSAPNCSASTCNWACANQGGWTGACGCVC